MTTTFTRTAGAVAYAAVVLWLLTAAAAAFDQFVGPPSDTRMYAVVSVLAALATAATAIVVAGILVRTGGLGDGDAWSVVALVLMVLATFMMAAAPWAWALTAIPLTGAAIITVWRMRSVGLGRPWSDWSLILAWPAGVLVFIVGELIRVGPQDFYGNYPYAFQAGLTLAVVAYSAGLIGVGRRLRSEQAVGAPTMAGIPA